MSATLCHCMNLLFFNILPMSIGKGSKQIENKQDSVVVKVG